MSYTPENLRLAAQILAERQADANNLQQARHNEAVRKIPEIAVCEAQLASTGTAVAEALSMGGDAAQYIEELSKINIATQKIIKEKLVKNGYPADYLETPYFCKKCSDTGYIDGRGCECRRKLLIELGIKDLEKVSPAANCRFNNFKLDFYSDEIIPEYHISPREKAADILEYCKCYAADFGVHSESLFFNGATGLGKTHLSLAIANEIVRNGYNVFYGSAYTIFSLLEKEKFSNIVSDDSSRIYDCDLLIIDDLGSEFITNFTVTTLYEIVNNRINRSKPVIISSNLTGLELETKYSQRIMSRIIGSYIPITLIGQDIRQLKAYNER